MNCNFYGIGFVEEHSNKRKNPLRKATMKLPSARDKCIYYDATAKPPLSFDA